MSLLFWRGQLVLILPQLHKVWAGAGDRSRALVSSLEASRPLQLSAHSTKVRAQLHPAHPAPILTLLGLRLGQVEAVSLEMGYLMSTVAFLFVEPLKAQPHSLPVTTQ